MHTVDVNNHTAGTHPMHVRNGRGVRTEELAPRFSRLDARAVLRTTGDMADAMANAPPREVMNLKHLTIRPPGAPLNTTKGNPL